MHAVWPDKIQKHLKQKHGVANEKGAKISEEIRQRFHTVAENPADFVSPTIPPEEIPHLQVYTDGFQCQVCQAIRKTREGIRKHCRQAHNRTEHTHRGQPSRAKQRAVARSEQPLWIAVDRFQRFFPSREHSNYFQVREQRGRQRHRVCYASEEVQWAAKVNGELDGIWKKAAEIRAKADRIIEEGETDEVNKWVDRTKWNRYLKGYEHEALLDLVEKPEEEEEVEDAIWSAMAGLAKFCQKTVAQKAGLFV